MRRNSLRKGSTPKFVSAEPKKTGESLPPRTASMSKPSPAPSSSSMLFLRLSAASSPIRAFMPPLKSVSVALIFFAPKTASLFAWKRSTFLVSRS